MKQEINTEFRWQNSLEDTRWRWKKTLKIHRKRFNLEEGTLYLFNITAFWSTICLTVLSNSLHRKIFWQLCLSTASLQCVISALVAAFPTQSAERVCWWVCSDDNRSVNIHVWLSVQDSLLFRTWISLHSVLYEYYVKCNSTRKSQRKFRRKFPKLRVLYRNTIQICVNKVRTTGVLVDRKPKHQHWVG
jgi:hypothetical protein